MSTKFQVCATIISTGDRSVGLHDAVFQVAGHLEFEDPAHREEFRRQLATAFETLLGAACGVSFESDKEPQGVTNSANFQVGDQATFTLYTDRRAGRIVEVSSNGKTVVFQEDEAILLNGMNSDHPQRLRFTPGGFLGHVSGEQIWELRPNPHGSRSVFTLRKNGLWKLKGDSSHERGMSLSKGADHYHDFNF